MSDILLGALSTVAVLAAAALIYAAAVGVGRAWRAWLDVLYRIDRLEREWDEHDWNELPEEWRSRWTTALPRHRDALLRAARQQGVIPRRFA